MPRLASLYHVVRANFRQRNEGRTSRHSSDKMSTTAVRVDRIAIAQDIAQECCLRIPMTEDEQISQRQGIFAAASAVKEMCNYKPANGKEDIAKLIFYCALVIEYATDFSVKNSQRGMSQYMRCVIASTMILPLPRQSLTVLLSVRKEMEHIKDILKSTDDVEVEPHMMELTRVLAHVRRLSHPIEICILTH